MEKCRYLILFFSAISIILFRCILYNQNGLNLNMAAKERQGFEEALKQLELIVETLSDPEIPLEKSVELYEEGLKLSKKCMETLENATLRIEKMESLAKGDDK